MVTRRGDNGSEFAWRRAAYRRRTLTGYLWASPAILGFLLWQVGPMVASLVMSFTKWRIVDAPTWIGIGNWRTMFTDDPLFFQSLKVSGIYAFVGVPLRLVIALGIALLMNQKHALVEVFRIIYYLPSIIAGVAVALLWSWVFHPEFGILNVLLSQFLGIQGPRWLEDPRWALPALILMNLWGVGGTMLIYLGGLQGVPTELYEAAEVDGAGIWTRFYRITLPMISPVLFFNLIMGLIGALQAFTQAYVMTNGGPLHATRFYLLHLYQNAFLFYDMGYASALAWMLFLIVLVMTLLIFQSSAAWVFYQGQEES